MDLFEDVRYSDLLWTRELPPRTDYFVQFMLIFVFPVTLCLLCILISAYAIFGRREGINKRDELLTNEELHQFDTIRRATTNMRLMSNYRSGPPLLHPNDAYNTPERSMNGHSSSTLTRSNAAYSPHFRASTDPANIGNEPTSNHSTSHNSHEDLEQDSYGEQENKAENTQSRSESIAKLNEGALAESDDNGLESDHDTNSFASAQSHTEMIPHHNTDDAEGNTGNNTT